MPSWLMRSAALRLAALLVLTSPGSGLAANTTKTPGSDAGDLAFLAENRVVMDRMMAGMDIASSHDADQDFAAMMIPHHQGAVDMAVLELRYGHNEQLRRIAQEIIVGQQQEIAAMRLALGRQLPPSVPVPPASGRMQKPMTH